MRALAVVLVLAPAARAVCPPEATTATWLQRPFGVGVRTLERVDRSRRTPPHAGLPGSRARTLEVEVWYQHRLTKGVEAAFFDATLKGSAAASCFLDEVLAAENPDVRVATHAAA